MAIVATDGTRAGIVYVLLVRDPYEVKLTKRATPHARSVIGAAHVAEQVRAEIRQDLEALDAYTAEHGSFAEMVQAHDAMRTED